MPSPLPCIFHPGWQCPDVREVRDRGRLHNFDKAMVVTELPAQGYNVIRLNPENPPERRLPMNVWVEATVIGNDAISAITTIYITNTVLSRVRYR